MRIVCIIHSLDGGGAERVMASLASRLAARAHRVTLVTLDDGAIERHRVDDEVTRQRLDLMGESHGPVAKFLNTRHRVHAIRAAIVEAAPDVVLAFCDRTNILTLMAARTLDTPVVISERSDPSQQKLGAAWEFLRRQAYAHATTIVALTESSAAHLRKRFRSPIAVVPSAVDPPARQSDRAAAQRHRRIVGVGRLEHEKGFDRLMDAFAPIAAIHPDWSLRILGEGSQRDALEQKIGDLQLTDRITMPGWIRPIWDELSAATIFALPSRYEGFPSALLEAMAVGVPSIAVDCESGPRAVIDDPQSGLLVPNDARALSDGIRRLVENEVWREQLGQAGKCVVDRFGWDAMVDQYEQILVGAADAAKPQR